MKLSHLLRQREALLRQARLANLAFAYQRLGEFAARIARGRLSGEVGLQEAAADGESYWASLTACEGSQSVIEEHFTEEDIEELADLIAYATDCEHLDVTFRIEELEVRYRQPLGNELERAGVSLERETKPVAESNHGSAEQTG
jgi:hypothetical protein